MSNSDFNVDPLNRPDFSTDDSWDDSDDTEPTGQYRGRKVIPMPNALSIIEEAAEEIGAEVEERFERPLEERHSARRSSDAAMLGSSESGEANSEDDDAPAAIKPDDLVSFLKSLRDRQDASEQDVLDQARKQFEDVSDQYAALAYAGKKIAGEDGDSPLAAAVSGARDALMKEAGPAVRAGLNILDEALAFAESGFATLDELREFYRKSILDFENIADLYDQIVKRWGKAGFKEAIGFLIKASGNDLAAHGPSLPAAQLKSITDQLYDVEVLGNLHRNFDDLLDRLRKLFRQALRADPYDLMKEVLHLTQERWVAADHVERIAQKADVRGVEPLIYFLTALKEQIRLIPLKIYPAMENRAKLLEAAQEALDIAVNQDA